MPRVSLATERDVLMPRNRLNRIPRRNRAQQPRQRRILRRRKRLKIAAFQLNADGKRIAPLAPAKRRHPRVIRHLVARHKLHHFPRPRHKKMAGHAQRRQQRKKRMFGSLNPVGKQFLHRARAIFKRRQRNIVQHHQTHRLPVRARATVGRVHLRRALPAPLLPNILPSIVHHQPRKQKQNYNSLATAGTPAPHSANLYTNMHASCL